MVIVSRVKKSVSAQIIANEAKFFAIAILCGLPSLASAIDWQIEPGIGASAMYSDNIYQVAEESDTESKEGEAFLQIEPSLVVFHKGASFLTDVRYRAQSYFFRKNSDLNNTDHQMDARISGWTSTRLFSMDLASTYSQQLMDPRERLQNSSFIDNGNETDVLTLRATPTINYIADSNFMLNMIYQWVDVDYKDDEPENISDTRINSLNSYIGSTDSPLFFGGARIKQDTIEYQNGTEVEFKSALVEAGFNVGDRTQIKAEVGEEKNKYASAVDASLPEGSFWQLSVDWGASETNRFELGIGERYFGNTGYFLWRKTGSRFSMGAGYNEEMKTEAQDLVDRPIDNDNDFINSGLFSPNTEVFLSQQGDIFIDYNYSKTGLRLGVNQELREYQESGVDESRTRLNASWRWLLMPRSTLVIRYSDIQYEYEQQVLFDSSEARASVSLDRQIGQRTSTNFEIGRNDRSSEDANAAYIENYVSLNFTVIF